MFKYTCHRRKSVYSKKIVQTYIRQKPVLMNTSYVLCLCWQMWISVFWNQISYWDLQYFLPLLGLEITSWNVQDLWISYSTVAGCLAHTLWWHTIFVQSLLIFLQFNFLIFQLPTIPSHSWIGKCRYSIKIAGIIHWDLAVSDT